MRPIYDLLKGRAPIIEGASPVATFVPEDDDQPIGSPLDGSADSVTGLLLIIDYTDSKGRGSTRRISCIRMDVAKQDRAYLVAWCHERRARRAFIISSIREVLDPHTGESLGLGQPYFHAFRADGHLAAGYRWGLSPKDYSDLSASLTALAFMARCDGQSHFLEHETIESFVAAWWIRREINHEIPEEEIAARAKKIAPDAESFVLALDRASQDPLTRNLLYRYSDRLIVADGRLDPTELYWMNLVREHLAPI